MSTETDEYLRGLYKWDEEQAAGPHVNWTNGFEASEDEYDEFLAEEGTTNPNAGGWWRFWEKD